MKKLTLEEATKELHKLTDALLKFAQNNDCDLLLIAAQKEVNTFKEMGVGDKTRIASLVATAFKKSEDFNEIFLTAVKMLAIEKFESLLDKASEFGKEEKIPKKETSKTE